MIPLVMRSSTRTKSLASKLVRVLVPAVLALIGVLTWTSYRGSSATLTAEIDRRTTSQIGLVSRQIELMIAHAESLALVSAAYQIPHGHRMAPGYPQFTRRLLNSLSVEAAYGLYTAFERKHYTEPYSCPGADRTDTTGIITTVDYDYKQPDVDWYAGPKASGTTFVSEPYFDDGGSNITMVSVTVPMKTANGEFIGVAGTDLSMDSMSAAVGTLRITEDAAEGVESGEFSMLVSATGALIYHPNEELLPAEGREGKSISDIAGLERVSESDSGKTYLVLDGEQMRVQWDTIPRTGWKIVSVVPEAAILAPVFALRNQMIAVAGIAAVLVCLAGYWFARGLARPLQVLAEQADTLARGDVSVEVAIVRNDEVGSIAESLRRVVAYQREMAAHADGIAQGDLSAVVTPKGDRDRLGHSFRHMAEQLRGLVVHIGEQARLSTTHAEGLHRSSEASAATAEQVSERMDSVAKLVKDAQETGEQMARASENLAQNATDSARRMSELAQAIALVSHSSDEHSKLIGEVVSAATQGSQAVTATNRAMSSIREEVAESARRVEMLGAKQVEIGAIAGTIGELAEQTNLLALNAAIEAARAGEMGRGFAVVADEVRKLAERSAEATRDIQSLINEVSKGISQAMESMRSSTASVEAGSAHTEGFAEALEEIARSVDSVRASLAESRSAVAEMGEHAEVVGQSIEAVASLSEEMAAGAEEVSAVSHGVTESASLVRQATRAQSREVAQLEQMAGSLTETAARLQELTSQFVLETPRSKAA